MKVRLFDKFRVLLIKIKVHFKIQKVSQELHRSVSNIGNGDPLHAQIVALGMGLEFQRTNVYCCNTFLYIQYFMYTHIAFSIHIIIIIYVTMLMHDYFIQEDSTI